MLFLLRDILMQGIKYLARLNPYIRRYILSAILQKKIRAALFVDECWLPMHLPYSGAWDWLRIFCANDIFA